MRSSGNHACVPLVPAAAAVCAIREILLLDWSRNRQGHRPRAQVRWLDASCRRDGGEDVANLVSARRHPRAHGSRPNSSLASTLPRTRIQSDGNHGASAVSAMADTGVERRARSRVLDAQPDAVDSGGTTRQCCRGVLRSGKFTRDDLRCSSHSHRRRRDDRSDSPCRCRSAFCGRRENRELHDIRPRAGFRRQAHSIGNSAKWQ